MEACAFEIARRQELRRFLMARRAAISPESVGFPGGSRRRAPGLRREEVASLSGIGVTWYTWFEQGRDIHVSRDALKRIARALRLAPSDEAYLFSLAKPSGDPETSPAVAPDVFQVVVDGFTAGPAILFSPVFNVLAYNRLADLVFEFDAVKGPFAHNHLWRLFMDPARRELYADYEKIAEITTGVLRQAHGRMLGDPFLDSVIRDLTANSALFRRLWDSQVTTLIQTIQVDMKLPRHGLARFSSVRLRPTDLDGWLSLLPPVDEHTVRLMQTLSGSTRARSAGAGSR